MIITAWNDLQERIHKSGSHHPLKTTAEDLKKTTGWELQLFLLRRTVNQVTVNWKPSTSLPNKWTNEHDRVDSEVARQSTMKKKRWISTNSEVKENNINCNSISTY